MGLMAATSIGIGGMIGAGIFSLLGLAAGTSGTQTYLAFLLSGLIALFCAYTFGKLGARFPSAGGPVEYLVRGAPSRLIAGVFNLLLWLGYVIVNALYARTFGECAVALISTASAINATLYGGANVSYIMAECGHLPVLFRRRLWQVARGGLLITSFLIVFFAIALPIEKIAMAGSLAFLLVYAAVNFAHLRLRHETGGRPIPIVIGLVGCVAGFIALAWHIATTAPVMLLVFLGLLGVSLAGELYMRREASERSAPSDRKAQ